MRRRGSIKASAGVPGGLVEVLGQAVGADADAEQGRDFGVVNLDGFAIGAAGAFYPFGQHIVASGPGRGHP